MEMDVLFIKMAKFMKEILLMVKSMVMVSIVGLIILHLKENTFKIKSMDSENILRQMGRYLKDNGKMEKDKVKDQFFTAIKN